MLDVGDGHRVYWECSGNPNGIAGIYLHGGPGGGCGNGARRYFDPDRYRIVLFDQRGCGRSRPLASDDDADLGTNTTHHLVSDIERLREHLAMDRFTVLGVSWGTTLALAYAQAHPERVRAMALALLTLTSKREVDWMTRDLGRVFPEAWERFARAVPAALRNMPLVDAYATMLFDAKEADRAAIEWCAWDDTQMGHDRDPRLDDAAYRLGLARLVTHYWRNAGFLEDGQLLRDIGKLEGIRGILVHGQKDMSCPLDVAWALARGWKTSELRVMDAGHGNDTTFPLAVTRALDDLADV
jgi:proline iminopeptidase